MTKAVAALKYNTLARAGNSGKKDDLKVKEHHLGNHDSSSFFF